MRNVAQRKNAFQAGHPGWEREEEREQRAIPRPTCWVRWGRGGPGSAHILRDPPWLRDPMARGRLNTLSTGQMELIASSGEDRKLTNFFVICFFTYFYDVSFSYLTFDYSIKISRKVLIHSSP